jgi:hypothetical protein
MIVCSCNVISEHEIEQVILDLLEEDNWRLIVPMQVYHALEKRGKCCGCFPNVVDIIVRVTEEFHREIETVDTKIDVLLKKLKTKHKRFEVHRISA